MAANSKRILIVEDEMSVGLTYQAWLKKAGLESVHVSTGEKALEVLETENFRVALLDLQLPDVNGIDILNFIKRKGLPIKRLHLVFTPRSPCNRHGERHRGCCERCPGPE